MIVYKKYLNNYLQVQIVSYGTQQHFKDIIISEP